MVKTRWPFSASSAERRTWLRCLQGVPPSIELTRADAVQPRNLCRRCARGQALGRDRLLLLGRPAAAAFATRDQIHPKGRSALTTGRMCALCRCCRLGRGQVRLHGGSPAYSTLGKPCGGRATLTNDSQSALDI